MANADPAPPKSLGAEPQGAPGSHHAFLSALSHPPVFAPLLLVLSAGLSWAFADRGLPLHDEGAQLTAAARILRGAVFYRDLDAYPFPAAAYLLAGAMSLFGEHLSVARALAGVLFCASALSLYAAARAVLRPAAAALFGLSLLVFKLVGWPAFSVYLYSELAFAFGCGALALLLHHRFRGPTVGLAAAGLLTGLAITAKQNLGLYLAFAGLVALAFPRLPGASHAPGRGREVAVFATCASLPGLAMAACFASQGLLGVMLYSGLVRPFTGYLPTSGIPYATPLAWWQLTSLDSWRLAPYVPLDPWLLLMRRQIPGAPLYSYYWAGLEVAARLVYTSVPVALGWAAWRRLAARSAAADPDREARVCLLAWLALAFVASALPRADWFHVFSVYPVVWLLLLALAQPAGPSRRSLRRGVAALTLALLLAAGLAGLQRSHLDVRLDLERASVDVHHDDAWVGPLMEQVAREIPPGEPLFVYGIEAHFYFLSGRFFPWPFSQLYPGMEGPGGGAALARRLAREHPAIVIQGVQRWPGLPPVEGFAPRLAAAIRARYRADPEFFARHGQGLPPPQPRVARVLRPRDDPDPGTR